MDSVTEYEITGEVLLQKVAFLNLTDYSATLADEASELIGKKVYLQLVSSDQVDPETGLGKTVGQTSYLEWSPWDGPISSDTRYTIKLKWNSALGFPGAFTIKNMHHNEFFLKSLTISIPGQGKVRFQCDSWITPSRLNPNDRVFFANKVCHRFLKNPYKPFRTHRCMWFGRSLRPRRRREINIIHDCVFGDYNTSAYKEITTALIRRHGLGRIPQFMLSPD